MLKYICDKCSNEITDVADIIQYGQHCYHKSTCWEQLSADELRNLIFPPQP